MFSLRICALRGEVWSKVKKVRLSRRCSCRNEDNRQTMDKAGSGVEYGGWEIHSRIKDARSHCWDDRANSLSTKTSRLSASAPPLSQIDYDNESCVSSLLHPSRRPKNKLPLHSQQRLASYHRCSRGQQETLTYTVTSIPADLLFDASCIPHNLVHKVLPYGPFKPFCPELNQLL